MDRAAGQCGRCHESATVEIARASLHLWEEPCISGEQGSGTIFFTGCPLGCVFCQNHNISDGTNGVAITTEELTQIMLKLQEMGANNINLVTPTHFTPQIVTALQAARTQNLTIPVVYNTSGYERVDTLKQLDGLVDIYLPDFKYRSPKLAAKYSAAGDYPEVAKAALQEMFRQVGKPVFWAPEEAVAKEAAPKAETPKAGIRKEETPFLPTPREPGLLQKGIIVRHLLLPGNVRDSKRVVKYLYETYGDDIFMSLMCQYTPLPEVLGDEFPELNQRVTEEEYDELIDYAVDLGVTNAFTQESESASESFIPDFEHFDLAAFLEQ